MKSARFEWDDRKDEENQQNHGVPFAVAQLAFLDPKRVILRDIEHSHTEERHYCIGQIEDGIVTVRFTYREGIIRIFGAGFWRKGKRIYEKERQIHR